MNQDFLDTATAKCRGDSRFTDYEEENPPSRIEAMNMCIGCPLLEACGKYAESIKPSHGVWAGEVWEMGKQGKGRKKNYG